AFVQWDLSWHCDSRSENDRRHHRVRKKGRYSQRSLRVSDALWSASRFAAPTCEGRLQHEGLCALRKTLVSLLHETVGGTTGQYLVCVQEPVQRLIRYGEPLLDSVEHPRRDSNRC